MKNRCFIKLCALFLSVWYLVAVFGFDVHSCSDDGRVYIGFLANGISCVNIHPETPCHHHGSCSCCECEEDGCEEGEDCCSDSIHRVVLSGSGDESSPLFAFPAQPFIAETNTPEASACVNARMSFRHGILRSPPPPDLSLLCMLKA